jgi:hypothetical protein
MIEKCPLILPTLVIADDARLAAQSSCVLAKRGAYLPVIDGPRLTRHDREAEVIRRNNAAARAKPKSIVFAGLSENSSNALLTHLPMKRVTSVCTAGDVDGLPRDGNPLKSDPLSWGRNRIGIGLLRALRSGTSIVFTDTESPIDSVSSNSGHLVVCEDGNDLSQVIAANYAFALGAGLHIIPEVHQTKTEQILENFYNLYEKDERAISQTEVLEGLKRELRDLCGPLPIPDRGSVTFITGGLPYGFAFTEAPSTHLFTYPDLGISIIDGLAAEQPGTKGIGVAAIVDPQQTDAPEIDAAIKLLPPRRILVLGYRGPAANVRSVAQMVELLPYDLLIIATHCGDASGFRWTYEYKDSEGINRTLVVDIAIGVARTDDEDMLGVTQFDRIISLDGVDWYDPEKTRKLYVGKAILDYVARTGSAEDLKPVKKETVTRVVGSAALKMYDHNFLALPRPLADHGTPILINNACGSWHRLAETFTFCNARVYIGTLFSVSTSEAHDVILKLLDKHFGKFLPVALWSAQREVYDGSVRRPYVMTGVFPQRLRVSHRDVPRDLAGQLLKALATRQADLQQTHPTDEGKAKTLKDYITFYERELAFLRERKLI